MRRVLIRRHWATAKREFAVGHARISERPRLAALIYAMLIVCATFADVVIFGTSLLNTDQLAAWDLYYKSHFVVPFLHGRGWWEFYADNGGSMWQSEPMMEFMRYCLTSWNSPYWNPYSAAGQLGPETLVDLKFSAITILYALLGGGSFVFNMLFLGICVMAAYCVIRIMRDRLMLSTVAAIAAAAFYMMNGHAIANATSNTFLSYWFVPLVLLSAITYIDRPNASRFAQLALSFALLLSYSFIPTTFMTMLAVMGCIAGYLFAHNAVNPSWRGVSLRTGGIGLAVIAAMGVLAVFFGPWLESVAQTETLDKYQGRVFYPTFLTGMFALFTPSHFYESYNAMEPGARNFFVIPKGTFPPGGNTIYHYGVIGLLVAACGLRFRAERWRWLVMFCLLTMAIALGRLFTIQPIDWIVAHLPILRNLGCQYWWVPVTVPLIFLVGLGMDNIVRGRVAKHAFLAMLLLFFGSGIYLGVQYGVHEPRVAFKIISIITSVALAIFTAVCVWEKRGRFIPKTRARRAAILTTLLIIELVMAGKQQHLRAVDHFASPPDWVHYIKTHIGPYRTLTINAAGFMGERGSSFQVPEVTSMNEGTLGSYTKYFHEAITLDPLQVNPHFVTLGILRDEPEKNTFHWDKIDLLGVKYVLIPIGHLKYREWAIKEGLQTAFESKLVVVFENPHVLPRAFVVPGQKAEDEITLPKNYRASIEPAEIAKYRNAEVELKGRSKKGGLLVLSDNWHPNWSATVNGEPASIVKVEGTFRGVVVPAGDYTVAMHYRPKTLTASLIISSISLVSLLLMLAFSRKNRH